MDTSGLFKKEPRTITQSQQTLFPKKEKVSCDRPSIKCSHYAVFHKDAHYFLPLPCNSWVCPDCGKVLKRDLIRRLTTSEANSWSVKTHVTLTVSGELESKVINEALNDLITFTRRGGNCTWTDFHGKTHTKYFHPRPNFRYLWTKEIQFERISNTGEIVLHLHMVVNQAITKYDLIPFWNHSLKLQTKRYTQNLVEARPLRGGENMSGYMTKYLTKTEHQELFDKGERRYGSSRGTIPPKPIRTPSGLWQFMNLSTARLVSEWFNCETSIVRKREIARQILDEYESSGSTSMHFYEHGVLREILDTLTFKVPVDFDFIRFERER